MPIVRMIIVMACMVWLSVEMSAQIQSVGIAGDGEITRITVISDAALNGDAFLGEGDRGRTIQLVPEVYQLGSDPYFGEPTGGVSAYVLDLDRITFELDRPMMIVRKLVLPPTGRETRYRYILDLARVSEARYSHAAASDTRRMARVETAPKPVEIAAIAAVTQVVASPPTSKPPNLGQGPIGDARPRHVVVIDPGHGGRDPGALAVSGGEEADIVLKTALVLRDALARDSRYDVRLTRETDVYIEHEDRVSMARNWGADLFISLHADAAGNAGVSGATVYTISTRGERRIEGTADKYGWELPIEDGTSDDVSGILEDLIMRETKSNSEIFAEFAVPELAEAGPLVRNTHRQKNLFVLLAPDVPAVLIEIGFLTNRSDARRLKSKRGRRKSADAIKRAIDTYFDRQDFLLASN